MPTSSDIQSAPSADIITVRGTQIRPSDARQHYREKIARVTLDSMVQFVGLLDAKGTVLEINKVALDAVGIALSEVEGKPFWTTFWWQVSPEINDTLRACIARAAKGEFVRWDTPIYGRAGGKETIVIDASLAPVFDDDGNVAFIAAEGRDITEKKAQEREIAQKNTELQALLERVRELDQVKTRFFANVSHEFRTPLTLMLGPLEDLLAKPRWDKNEGDGELVSIAHRNALRLLKLVNALLDFSRIEAGRTQLSIEPGGTDLCALTIDLASVFRSAIERAGLVYVVRCEPLSCPAFVDAGAWEKIVLNLLSNAFKFTLHGSITASLRESGGKAILTIADTGAGIPPAELPNLFTRFHRVHGARGRSHEGTGIGLSLILELVKFHGGTVSVESHEGIGTTFTVAIPLGKNHLAPELLAPKPASTAAAAPDRARKSLILEEAERWLPLATDANDKNPDLAVNGRIVLADDNADMRDYVKRLLEQDGYVVEAVPNGQSAIAVMEQHRPDLVLSDVMMPVMDGFQFLRAVRSHPTLNDVVVVLLSARAGEESKVEGLQRGADDYLVKPFSAVELRARVRANIAISRMRRESADRERALRLEAEAERDRLRIALREAQRESHARGTK